MKSKRFAVVTGYYNNDTHIQGMIQCIGVYSDSKAAYGDALLHLNEVTESELMISPLFELEGESGYGMEAKGERITDFAYVLFVEDEDER